MGLSLREIVAVLDWLGVDRSHGAVWNWTHTLAEAQDDPPTAEPSRVAVDETQIEVEGENKWLYAAIDTESKLLLEIDVYSRRGIGPAAFTRSEILWANQNASVLVTAFLHRLSKKHDVSDTEFLVDGLGT
jgi:putative transposase